MQNPGEKNAPATTGAASGAKRLLPLVMTLFFAWGFCTSLVDVLIPKLKATFSLNYAEAMLSQTGFFLAYFVIGIPAGMLISRVGYVRGVVIGLGVMALGCLLFTPAASLGWYPGFLAALFVLAGGITVLQVAANPLAANLGAPEGASSRLTLAQAFNSVGTTLGPLFGSWLILSAGVSAPSDGLTGAALDAFRIEQSGHLRLPYLIIAVVLVLMAVGAWYLRRMKTPPVHPVETSGYARLLSRPRLMLGAVSIFLYVGAEVAIGSSIVNFLLETGAVSKESTAGNLISVYWGLAMVGRFIGSYLLRVLPPAAVLCSAAVCSGVLAIVAGTVLSGVPAAVAILAIGLFNSVMFPTIFSLAIEGLGEDTPGGSGLLCQAIVGGAIIPLLTGFAADRIGLGPALVVPACCYGLIAGYGLLVKLGVLGTPATGSTGAIGVIGH